MNFIEDIYRKLLIPAGVASAVSVKEALENLCQASRIMPNNHIQPTSVFDWNLSSAVQSIRGYERSYGIEATCSACPGLSGRLK